MEPSPRTRRALKAYRGAMRSLELSRGELYDAIRADLDAGIRQADLVRATGWTREHIRQIDRTRDA